MRISVCSSLSLIAVMACAVLVAWSNAAFAQQLFVEQTGAECAAKGGHITVWTNTAGVGTDVGECYVPPSISNGGAAGGGSSGGGANTLSTVGAGLGVLGAFINLLDSFSAFDDSRGKSDISSQDWYQDIERQARAENVSRDAATSDLISMLDAGPQPPAGADLATLCPMGPGTAAAVAECNNEIASAFEQQALQCAGANSEECRRAMFRSAVTARCIAARSPSPEFFQRASEGCIDDPSLLGLKDQYDSEQQLKAAEAWSNSLPGKPSVEQECLEVNNPSICDLYVKVTRAEQNGTYERTDTPFMCGHANGRWEGDIVDGHCRLPGDTSPSYDPYKKARQLARYMKDDLRIIKSESARGNADSALVFTGEMERNFARVIMQLTTARPDQRQEILQQVLPLIDELATL